MKKNKNNPAKVWLSTLNSQKSINSYTFVLNSLCRLASDSTLESFDWLNFGYTDLLTLRKKLIDKGLMASSINVYLSTFKSVFREAWRLELITIDKYMRIQDVRGVKGKSPSAGRALSVSELKNTITFINVKSKNKSVRDSAIISLCYGAGLRISEVIALDISDFSQTTLIVKGKGGIIRRVFLPVFTQNHLKSWLDLRGDFNGAIFTVIMHNGTIKEKRLASRTVGNVIANRQKELGIDRFTPHDLRRSFGTHLLNNGVDILTVQKLMRHASVNTTRIYDKRDDKTLIAALEKLPF